MSIFKKIIGKARAITLTFAAGLAVVGMATAQTSWEVHSNPQMFLNKGISASKTVGIEIAAPKINGTTITYPTLSGGVLRIRSGSKREDIYYSSGSVNSTTKVVTLYGVTRDICFNLDKEFTSCNGAQQFSRGSVVELSNHHLLFNLKLNFDRRNDFMSGGVLRTDLVTQPFLFFGDVTTTERDAFGYCGESGDMVIIANTTVGVPQYSMDNCSSWLNIASTTGSFVNADETSAGKVQLATTADHLASTATGTTGAPLAVWVANLVSSHKVYTPAYAFCGSGATTLVATWAGTTDASFRVTVDGTVRDVTALDFTGITSMTGAAAKMQTALRAVTSREETITWTADGTSTGFTITSANTTSGSAISLLSAVGAGTGTDISGAGATAYMDCDSGSAYAAITAAVKDVTQDSYKVPILNSSGVLSPDLGGSGSGNLSNSGLLIGNGNGSYRTLNACADNYVVTSDGTNWGCELVTASSPKTSITNSTATGTSTTSVAYFDDHIHTISGGTLSTGDVYEVEWDVGIRLDLGSVDVHFYVDGKDAGFTRHYYHSQGGGDKVRPYSGKYRFTVRDADATGSIQPGGWSVGTTSSGNMMLALRQSDGTVPDAIGSINWTTDTEVKLAAQFSASDAQHTAYLTNIYYNHIKR